MLGVLCCIHRDHPNDRNATEDDVFTFSVNMVRLLFCPVDIHSIL